MKNNETYSVLICDDDPNNRKILQRYLEQNKYLVMLASDAHEALEVLRVVVPDAIMMDYQMPNLNGIDTIRLIRTVNQRSTVILMTAYGSDEVREEAILSEADYFLPKPINYKMIGDLIKKQIIKRQSVYPIEISYADILSGIEDYLYSTLLLKNNLILFRTGLWDEKEYLTNQLPDNEDVSNLGLLSAINNVLNRSDSHVLEISLGSQHLYVTKKNEFICCLLIPSAIFVKIEKENLEHELTTTLNKFISNIIKYSNENGYDVPHDNIRVMNNEFLNIIEKTLESESNE